MFLCFFFCRIKPQSPPRRWERLCRRERGENLVVPKYTRMSDFGKEIQHTRWRPNLKTKKQQPCCARKKSTNRKNNQRMRWWFAYGDGLCKNVHRSPPPPPPPPPTRLQLTTVANTKCVYRFSLGGHRGHCVGGASL